MYKEIVMQVYKIWLDKRIQILLCIFDVGCLFVFIPSHNLQYNPKSMHTIMILLQQLVALLCTFLCAFRGYSSSVSVGRFGIQTLER